MDEKRELLRYEFTVDFYASLPLDVEAQGRVTEALRATIASAFAADGLSLDGFTWSLGSVDHL